AAHRTRVLLSRLGIRIVLPLVVRPRRSPPLSQPARAGERMVPLASLWLPILLSAVVVFISSSLLHMVLKYHATDFATLPNEEAVLDALRPNPPGDYMLPRPASREQMKDPAFQEKMKRGVAVLTIMRGDPQASFKKALALWFVYSLVVSVFAAYIAGRALRQ